MHSSNQSFEGGAPEMTSVDQQLRRLARLERLQVVRNWALGLGIVALVSSIGIAGFGSGIENPKSASSMFSALAQAGFLRWVALPLVIAGASLLAAAIGVQIFLAKNKR